MNIASRNKSIIILYSSIGISLIINTLFYGQFNLGLNLFLTTLSLVLATLGITVYSKRNGLLGSKDKRIFNKAALLYIPIVFVSLVPTLSQNTLLNFVAFILALEGWFFVTLYYVWGISIKKFTITKNLKLWLVHFIEEFNGISKFLEGFNHKVEKKTGAKLPYSQVGLGVLVAIPFLCIFWSLFTASDALFSAYAGNLNILQSLDLFNLVASSLTFFILLPFILINLIGIFYNSDDVSEENKTNIKELDATFANTFMILINTLFFFYVIALSVYLFGGDAVTRQLGIVYSEYARRGFFEMILILSLSLTINYVINSAYKKASKNSFIFLKALTVVNLFFNAIILISAIQRNLMYINAYGLTNDRFNAMMIIAVYAFMLIFFIGSLFIDIFRIASSVWDSKSYVKLLPLFTFVVIMCVISITGFINPDRTIAQFNINRYLTQLEKSPLDLDTYYLIRSSSDGYVELLKNEKTFVKLAEVDKCRIAYEYDKETRNIISWQEFNINVFTNREIVESKLEKYLDYDESVSHPCYKHAFSLPYDYGY